MKDLQSFQKRKAGEQPFFQTVFVGRSARLFDCNGLGLLWLKAGPVAP